MSLPAFRPGFASKKPSACTPPDQPSDSSGMRLWLQFDFEQTDTESRHLNRELSVAAADWKL